MNLQETFAVLRPDLRVQPVAVSPGVYQELDARFNGFKGHVLVASYAFEKDWGVWERHPAGDEIVVLLSGAARMVLRTEAGESVTELKEPGSFIVIPQNVWHTAWVDTPTQMLFITPGEGTENRADI